MAALPPSSQPASANPQYQYGRKCTLLVSNRQGKALDLSQLRIKFSVKRTNAQTPNTASIKVYNLTAATELQIEQQFKRVVLQGGYDSNFGVIFAGNIKQTIRGRESATETYIELLASDGDLAYNFAIVNTSLAAGSTPQTQIDSAVAAMAPMGTTAGGNTKVSSTTKLPRGKVLYGNARTYLRNVAQSTNCDWSIQDEKVVFVPKGTYLPGTAVAINTKTGMVGSPAQTLQGVNVKVLLNPMIQISTRVQLNNQQIQRLAINLAVPGTAAAIPAPLTTDGIYFVLVAEHTGDTRGLDWYTTLTTVYIDPTLPVQAAQAVSFD
jgi:hypothetical protein